MLTAVDRQQVTMIVGRVEAAFIGVSGRAMATLEPGTEVTRLGEYGPYTVVHWNGRNGYIQTDLLLSADQARSLDTEQEQKTGEAEEDSASTRGRFRFFPWRQRAA